MFFCCHSRASAMARIHRCETTQINNDAVTRTPHTYDNFARTQNQFQIIAFMPYRKTNISTANNVIAK